MRQGNKTILLALLTLLTATWMEAVTTVKKPRPKVEVEDMLITVPGRFYYFDEDELHCYNTKSGEDALIVKNFTYETGSSKYRIVDVWHDAATDRVYMNLDQSGTQIQNKLIYQLTPDYSMEEIIALTGDIGDVLVDVTDDYVCLNGFIENCKIPGIGEEGSIYEFFTKGFKPWKMTKNSLNILKKPEIDFYAITTSGVNVRSYGDSKAPRIGHFKARANSDEQESYLTTEDDDIDTSVFTRTFIPWHPEVGSILASKRKSYYPQDWINILLSGLSSDAFVSSRYVRKIENEPLVSMQQLTEGDLKERVCKMNSTKYPGVWLMLEEPPECGEPALYIGKEVDGLVVFKWRAGWVVFSGESGKRIQYNQYHNVLYDKEITKNEYELDLSKINDNDLETLFKIALPDRYQYPVMVKIPGYGVGVFELAD